MNLFFLVLILFISITLLLYCIIFSSFIIISFFTNAPFVPVKKNVVKSIIESLKLSSGAVFYDLGCGDGRILKLALEHNKNIKVIGYEMNTIPYIFSKWNLRNSGAKVRFGNFLNADLHDATHIYLYLFPAVVQTLYKKIKKECAPGTRIVSCDYPILDIDADEIIDLPQSKSPLCKKLFVYILK